MANDSPAGPVLHERDFPARIPIFDRSSRRCAKGGRKIPAATRAASWSLASREILIVLTIYPFRELEIVTASNEEVHVVGHDYVSSDCHAKFIERSSDIFLKCLMDRFQIFYFPSVNRANRHKEQRRITCLKKSDRGAVDDP